MPLSLNSPRHPECPFCMIRCCPEKLPTPWRGTHFWQRLRGGGTKILWRLRGGWVRIFYGHFSRKVPPPPTRNSEQPLLPWIFIAVTTSSVPMVVMANIRPRESILRLYVHKVSHSKDKTHWMIVAHPLNVSDAELFVASQHCWVCFWFWQTNLRISLDSGILLIDHLLRFLYLVVCS